MTIARSVAEVLNQHVTLELECIDRMYLNLYVPILQAEAGVAWFFRHHRGHQFASSALMAPMSRGFVQRIEAFAEREGIDLIVFRRGERKEDVAQRYLADFSAEEGVLFIGKAQEKASVIRTELRRNPRTGASYAWLVKSSAIVNQYYFYCVDRDFGPRSHRYPVTEFGFRSAVFLTRSYTRLLRHGLAVLGPDEPPRAAPLRDAVHRIENAIDQLWRDAA